VGRSRLEIGRRQIGPGQLRSAPQRPTSHPQAVDFALEAPEHVAERIAESIALLRHGDRVPTARLARHLDQVTGLRRAPCPDVDVDQIAVAGCKVVQPRLDADACCVSDFRKPGPVHLHAADLAPLPECGPEPAPREHSRSGHVQDRLQCACRTGASRALIGDCTDGEPGVVLSNHERLLLKKGKILRVHHLLSIASK